MGLSVAQCARSLVYQPRIFVSMVLMLICPSFPSLPGIGLTSVLAVAEVLGLYGAFAVLCRPAGTDESSQVSSSASS